MSKITVNVSFGNVSFPPGTAPVDHLLLTLTGTGSNVQTATAAPSAPSVSIDSLAPDTYTPKLQALDATGNVLAQKVDGPVTVAAPPPVVLSVPVGISTVVS